METDESYSLTIPSDGDFRITAETTFGAIYGLKTLIQLISVQDTFVIQAALVNISDSPRFRHRELLVDTSRHFITPPKLKIILDGMAMSKLNVFHWHIVDSQSFPFQSVNSAYSTSSTTKNETYNFVKKLLRDVSTMFPDNSIHIGGDEVNVNCWNTISKIKSYAAELRMEISNLTDYFIQKLMPFLLWIKKSNDILGRFGFNSRSKYTSGFRCDSPELARPGKCQKTHRFGIQCNISPSEYLYLDCGQGNWINGGVRPV